MRFWFSSPATLLLAMVVGASLTLAARGETVNVAAAANLLHAMPALAVDFETRTSHDLRISYGSSGNLARQIRQGAPFQVFLSANEAYVEDLRRMGHTLGQGRNYAVGRMALFIPSGSPLFPLATGKPDLATILDDPVLRRLAIANPDHAPYGMLAREALVRLQVWDAVRDRLVLGDSAAQAVQFAVSGNVDAALLPYTALLVPKVGREGRFWLLDEGIYTPLQQRMTLLPGAGDGAQALFEYLQSAAAHEILGDHGFLISDDGI